MSVEVLVGKFPAQADVAVGPHDVVRGGACQARGGPAHAGPVRSYTFTAEDHCGECEADEPVTRFVLRVSLCGAHALSAMGLGMVPLEVMGG